MENIVYKKAIQLLEQVATPYGFLASAQNISNYKRVWARDGVICGLAALSSADKNLIDTFEATLHTLAKHQHKNGTIPSNVQVFEDKTEVSYGGLAGRVDAVSWFIVGVCQYAHYMQQPSFVTKYETEIQKALQLLEAWEFNNKHLLYVPLSGNWADEYITDGYTLYDQVLRIWALKSYNYFKNSQEIQDKIISISNQVELNFTPNTYSDKFHPKAYSLAKIAQYMPCSFSPSGYKTRFDAFGNALALLLNIGNSTFQDTIIEYALTLIDQMPMKLLPAFWEPIFEDDADWNLLKNNCKYEFRNFPYEFHNAGSWTMVNMFFAMALISKNKITEAQKLLEAINLANSKEDFSFYENFNSKTTLPNGVPYCAWSAAATVLTQNAINNNYLWLK